MPPKGSEKPKTKDAPKSSGDNTQKVSPKKTKEPRVFNTLVSDTRAPAPIQVAFDNQSQQAKSLKSGDHVHTLQLKSKSSFALDKTVVFTDGEFEGLQAIILKPAKAFPFLKLPKNIQIAVLKIVLAPADGGGAIALDGKRHKRDIIAKSYADAFKNRVAILAVGKEIHDDASQIFYDHTFRFDNTSVLLDFLGQVEGAVRARLRKVEVKALAKNSARTALGFLAESRHLTRLHIDSGVFAENDAPKAAKSFHSDAGKLLSAVGAARGDKLAGVDILSFGRNAFTFKDDKKGVRPWSAEMVEDFRENLRAKLKSMGMVEIYREGCFRAYGYPPGEASAKEEREDRERFGNKVERMLLGL